METQTLRTGHLTVSGPENEGLDPSRSVSPALEAYYKRHEELRGVPGHVIRKAWFTMAHLLVRPGATVVDMGTNVMMTFAMALLNPRINFVGADPDKKLIKAAQKNFTAPNLEYRFGDILGNAGFEKGSVDAVVNSFILHEIFSAEKYLDRPVISALENHFSILKPEGLMFIRDFTMPPEQFVLMEMPEAESRSEAIGDLSEADLLVRFSHDARPYGNKNLRGFFLDELPPRFPKTRLFRLPYKWAYEFIMRKDDREHWQAELYKEYAFFTQREYRKNLRALGARVLYTAPQWDDALIKESFEGKFRLYNDEGKPLGSPPTGFIAVAQKMGEKKSLNLHELRPSHSVENQIRVTAMRNDTTGEILDIVSRDMDLTEVIPYRVTENGDLNVFIHDGLPRGIANAVPRSGKELDGKRWSGHMTEAIAVPTEAVYAAEQGEPKETVLFARDFLGLKPAMGSLIEKGKPFYPAPDFIDEQVKTRYLRVVEHEGAIEPRRVANDIDGFTTRGTIREVSAQSILDAISVGYIPNARLETQILDLYTQLGMEAETWDECPLALDVGTPDNMLDMKKFVNDFAAKDKRFRAVKGTAGQVRAVKSIFVDEGWVEGGIEGLASRDIEFVISDDQTVNKAVILPLTKSAKTGEIMAGLVSEFMPVPQRHQGTGLSLRAPSITLPKEITSIDQAKKFIADQFEVGPEKVARLGESYFCHIGVTPVRIFPFCVSTAGTSRGPLGGPVQYAPMKRMFDLVDRLDCYNHQRWVLYRYRKAYLYAGKDSEISGDWERSSDKVYEATMKSAPAIINSTVVNNPTPPSPLPTSGRANVVVSAPYATSPDFLDVRNENKVKTETNFSPIQSAVPTAKPEETYVPQRAPENNAGSPENTNKQTG